MVEDVAEWGKAAEWGEVAVVVRVEADRAEVAWAAHLPLDPADSACVRSADNENHMSAVCPASCANALSAGSR
jgi:hypothetical protein